MTLKSAAQLAQDFVDGRHDEVAREVFLEGRTMRRDALVLHVRNRLRRHDSLHKTEFLKAFLECLTPLIIQERKS